MTQLESLEARLRAVRAEIERVSTRKQPRGLTDAYLADLRASAIMVERMVEAAVQQQRTEHLLSIIAGAQRRPDRVLNIYLGGPG